MDGKLALKGQQLAIPAEEQGLDAPSIHLGDALSPGIETIIIGASTMTIRLTIRTRQGCLAGLGAAALSACGNGTPIGRPMIGSAVL